MKETDLKKTYFIGANIYRANLDLSNFHTSVIRDCDLNHCSLKNVAFEETRVNESNLENVDFTHAHLDNCHFENIRAKEAIFIDSELHRTYFVDTDLSKTDFTGATFNDVFMIGVNLRGAKLNPDQLNLITFGKQVIFPNGKKKYFAPEIVKEDRYVLTKYAGKIAYKVFDFRDSLKKLKT